jgi:hypothetical protein
MIKTGFLHFLSVLVLFMLVSGRPAEAQLPDECNVYQPGPPDRIIYIEIQSGGALSNITVGGMEMENATSATRLVIPAGEQAMLYLVLKSTEPVIWEMTGNTSRISRIVVAGPTRMSTGKVAAGVTGVAADRVSILPGQKCISNMPRIFKARSPAESTKQILGRNADIFKTAHSPLLIHVSSGGVSTENPPSTPSIRLPPQGVDTRIWERFIKAAPGGIENLRGITVISDSNAEPYPVMPGWAGLIQLVLEGKLVPSFIEMPGHTTHFADGRTEPRTELVFKLVKPADWFPAGLKGGHAVAVVLGPGISLPKGDFGHCCVISEETHEALVNPPVCKGRYGFLMK